MNINIKIIFHWQKLYMYFKFNHLLNFYYFKIMLSHIQIKNKNLKFFT